MSVITSVLKHKVLLVAGVSIVLVGVVWATAQPRQSEQPVTQVSEQDKKLFSSNDKKKQTGLEAIFNTVAFAYTSRRQSFPEATAAGWKTVIDDVAITESFIDPYTGTLYRFAAGEPDYGEIEYKPGFVCKEDGKTLVKGQTAQVLAVRALFSDGIRCVGSLES